LPLFGIKQPHPHWMTFDRDLVSQPPMWPWE
jgi:hypothetical protein